VIKNYRATHANVLPVNGGGWAMPGVAESQKVQSYFLMDAMGAMQYTAVNVTPSELQFGVEALRQKAVETKLDLVSSNLKRKSDDKFVFNPYVVRDVKGIRVAFMGVMPEGEPIAPTTNEAENLTVLEPHAAVQALLPEVRAKADVVVVFSHLAQRRTQQLVDEVKGIDIAVSGGDGFVNQTVTEVGADSAGTKSLVLEAGERGKYLGALVLVVSEHGKILRYTHQAHQVDKNTQDDSTLAHMVTGLKQHLKDVRKREAVESVVGQSTAPGAAAAGPQEKFLGALMCARCHQTEYESWKDSKHAHSMASLESKAMEGAAECLQCHVTGYNVQSGYPTAQQELGTVSCEQCHGFGTLHGDGKFQTRPAESTCVACHDAKNSPNFDYKTYWSRMAH
jgi:2',3'-cyclic-nucleotide 2'-phosphodiesterase (5'-nucleotidase family)